MKKTSFCFLIFFLAACTQPQKYNCYVLDWDIVSYDGIHQPYISTQTKWKNITRQEAVSFFNEYMEKTCSPNEKLGYSCINKTENSFTPVNMNIMQGGEKSMFCIPLDKDMQGVAQQYAEKNIKYYSGAPSMFPMDKE